MSTSRHAVRSRSKTADWNVARVSMIVIPFSALLVAGSVIATGVTRHSSPVPVEKYYGRMVTSSVDGKCAQYEFNNVRAELTPQGTTSCTDVLASERKALRRALAAAPAEPVAQTPSHPVARVASDPVVTGKTGARMQEISKHFRSE